MQYAKYEMDGLSNEDAGFERGDFLKLALVVIGGTYVGYKARDDVPSV